MTPVGTIPEMAEAFRTGRRTSVALVREMLDSADRSDRVLGVYLRRFDDQALSAAEQADDELARGIDRGPLHGIPIAVKDVVATREAPSTGQSLVTDERFGAAEDATVIGRLRDAGAVVLGKTTTMEFAVGFPDPSKPFPIPRNPWDPRCWPGGSSSGSASGVAAGYFLAGIGTDTGGSIRCPAAFTGVSGLKPTFGRVPRTGVLTLSDSADHVGQLARSAWELAAILNVIAGADGRDRTCITTAVPDFLDGIGSGVDGLRVGVVRGAMFDAVDPAIASSFEAAAAQFELLGAHVVSVELPMYSETVAAASIVLLCEGAAYHRTNLQNRWDDFFASTREHLLAAAFLTPSDYLAALQVRALTRRQLDGLFAGVDVVLCPTMTITSPSYERIEREGLTAVLGGRGHTNYWNITGNPVAAVPIGLASDGLPVSMQIAGRPFDEATVLRAAYAYQGVTNWHLRQPPDMADQSSLAGRVDCPPVASGL